jgi:hypothetical protein
MHHLLDASTMSMGMGETQSEKGHFGVEGFGGPNFLFVVDP